MKNIGYSDFIRICQIERIDTWCDWLSIRPDGVYVEPPGDDVELTPEERATLTEHPTGNLNEPALSFPCDVSTLAAFLERQEIGVAIDDAYLRSVGYPECGEPIKPKQRSQVQDEEILALLRTRGYDPLALPPYAPGKSGVKAEIKAALGNKGMWAGKTVFSKAWDRLTKNKDIAYRRS